MTLGGLHGSDAASKECIGMAKLVTATMQASMVRVQIRVADLIDAIVPQVVRSVQQIAVSGLCERIERRMGADYCGGKRLLCK